MPGVSTHHADYDKFLPKWRRCRDAAAGQDAVHNGREAYLPKLKEQEETDYIAYIERTPWFNATWRTIEGLRGMILRLPPKLDVAANVKAILDNNVDGAGTPLASFIPEVIEEAFKIGRLGLFIDYPNVPVAGTTQADAELQQLAPRMLEYRAEQIINWRTQAVGNKKTLVLVVLEEDYITPKNEFETLCVKQWRVLELVSLTPGATAIYRVRVFQKGLGEAAGHDVQIGVDVFPQMGGKNLSEIPFYFIDTDECGPDCDDPPLIDLVNMNMSHYRTSADLEHGAHFTALPTAWVSGYKKEDGEKFYIGSQSAWVFGHPQAKVGFLEFSGEGLKALEAALDRKEKQMAVLGARMLEEQKRGVETAEVAAIHRSGEQSMLAAAAWAISFGFTRALQLFSDWAGGKSKVAFELNRRFFPTPMTSEELAALVAAWQQGAISYETLFENMKEGDIVAQDLTAEQEQTKIQNTMDLVPAASAAKAAAHTEATGGAGAGSGSGGAPEAPAAKAAPAAS